MSDPIKNNDNEVFPVFLKVSQLHFLLVGAESKGTERLNSILNISPSAFIRIVATRISDEIKQIAAQNSGIQLIHSEFKREHLDGIDIVFSTIDNYDKNVIIREACRQKNIFINFVYGNDMSDFDFGPMVQQGSLKVSISGGKRSAEISNSISELLIKDYPDELQEVLENLKNPQDHSANNHPDRKVDSAIIAQPTDSLRSLKKRIRKVMIYSALVIICMISGHLILSQIPTIHLASIWNDFSNSLDENFHYYFLAGLIAQLIDGALGMAYGVSVTTFLLSLGLPAITPAVASASMHASEIFTTGASSLVYMRYKNINKKLFKSLLIPGIAGAVLGALSVTFFSKDHVHFIRPFVACYTMILGILIIVKAMRIKKKKTRKFTNFQPIAAVGGFLDSLGGGGWGPIVTTSLIAGGRNLRFAIGSSHLTKFFVASVSTLTFFLLIGIDHWQIIFGLVLGGMIAAPVSIYLSSKIPTRPGLIFVGALVIILSLRTIINTFL